MTRMTTDVDALSNFLQTGLATALISVLSLVGVLVALLLLDAAAVAGAGGDAAGAVRRHPGLPPAGGAGLRRGARAGQHGQRPVPGERGRRPGRPGVQPGAAQRPVVPLGGQRLPQLPDARPDLHRGLLPVRAVPGRPGRRAGTRLRRAAAGRTHPERGRADRVLPVSGRLLRPGAAAVAGVRRLPAGLGRAVPAEGPAAHPDQHARGRQTRSPVLELRGEVSLVGVDFAYQSSGKAGCTRHRPADPGRPVGGAGGPDRRRQVDPGQADRAVLRPDRRRGHGGRRSTCGSWIWPATGSGWASCRRRPTCPPARFATRSPTAGRRPPTPRSSRPPARSARTT